jgi:hypothetical protein
LITRGTSDSEGVEIYSPFDYICWMGDFVVDYDRVSLKEDILKKVFEAVFGFDTSIVSISLQ